MTSERAYKTEVYYRGRSVSKAGYHGSRNEAASVYEVRVLNHGGKILDTFKKEDG